MKVRRIAALVVWCLTALVAMFPPTCRAYETGGVAKTKMSNGLTLLVRREAEAPVVAIEIFVRVGVGDEDPKATGIGQVLAGTILAGTEFRGATRLARLMSEVGGNFHALWRWNYLEMYAVTVPDRVGETIGLLADAVQESSLGSESIEYAKSAIARERERQEEDPFGVAYSALRRAVHRGSVYERTELGDPTAVARISEQQLKAFYAAKVSPDRIVVSVVGRVDPDAVSSRIERSFGGMASAQTKSRRPSKAATYTYHSPSAETIRSQGSMTYQMLGYPAPGVESPDHPAMCVANVLLGGNKSSLLFGRLREEKGLGYQVGSLYPSLTGASHVAAYLGMDSSRATPELVKTVRDTMAASVQYLRDGRFSDDDLRRAKGYLIGRHAVKHERTRDRAFLLGWHEVMGLGYQYDFLYADKVEAVSREDVVRVCRKYLTDPCSVVLEGTSAPSPAAGS